MQGPFFVWVALEYPCTVVRHIQENPAFRIRFHVCKKAGSRISFV